MARRTATSIRRPAPGDAGIRAALIDRLRRRFNDKPGITIIEELGLREGRARLDIALVTDTLHGYEIKSDRDTTRRLRRQSLIYGTVCDRMTLVAGERTVRRAVGHVPDWWEIIEAIPRRGSTPGLRQVRRGRTNHTRTARALIELLWRPETLRLLVEHDIERGVVSKPRAEMWNRAIDRLPARTVIDKVIAALHERDYTNSNGTSRRVEL